MKFDRVLNRERKTNSQLSSAFVFVLFAYTMLMLVSFAPQLPEAAPVYVLAGFPIILIYGAIHGLVVDRLYSRKISILWLRRFHHEVYPEFPLSHCFESISRLGFPTITLRDTAVSGGRTRRRKFVSASALLWPFLGVASLAVTGALVVAGTSVADSLGLIRYNYILYSAVSWGIPVMVGMLAIGPSSNLLARLFGGAKIARRAPKSARKLRRWVQTLGKGLAEDDVVVLRSSDEDWQELVLCLMASADIVIVDLQNPTEHLQWEVARLRDIGKASRTIWMLAENVGTGDQLPQIVMNEGHFAIGDTTFSGNPNVLRYPRFCCTGFVSECWIVDTVE